MGEFVRVEIEAAVAVVRLSRPKMNALNAQVQTEIAEAASRLATDHQVRAVILYGGEKVFAAGADIKEMADAGYAEMAVNTQRLQSAFTAIAQLPQPVIAAVTGYALGGGLELALCADFRILGESAKVGQPEIQLGVIPGGGGTQRLPRLVGPSRAMDQGLDVDLASGLQLERLQFAALFATEDQKAGMRSFVENGPGKASFTGQ